MLQTLETLALQIGISLQTMLIIGVGCGAVLTFFGVVSAVSGGNPAANRMAAVALNHKTRRKDNDLLRMADADPTGLMKTIMPKDYNERTKIQLQLAQSGLTSAHAVRNFYLIRAFYPPYL